MLYGEVRLRPLLIGVRPVEDLLLDEASLVLAVLSGIDSSNIRSYESGRSILGILTLVRIAEALKAEPGFFLEELSSSDFASAATDGRRRAS